MQAKVAELEGMQQEKIRQELAEKKRLEAERRRGQTAEKVERMAQTAGGRERLPGQQQRLEGHARAAARPDRRVQPSAQGVAGGYAEANPRRFAGV
jgi:hypothetical protein